MTTYISMSSMILIVNIFKFSKKKLVTLMMLELLMFNVIVMYSFSHYSSENSPFFMIMMSIFMVLDSVFGICILLNVSRTNSVFMIKPIMF